MEEALLLLEAEIVRRGEALREREIEAARIAGEAESLRRRVESSEARADEAVRSVAAMTAQLEELLISARGSATRIRLAALREAADVNARLVDFNDPRLAEARDRLQLALEDALARVAGEWEAGRPEPPLLGTPEARIAYAGGQVAGASRQSLVVDIGPFDDFSQLVRFEDAANSIGATGDISIRRFSGGRAQIDVALTEPIDLLRELEERTDLDFRVRSRTEDAVVLDLN